jgi:hypothetical protein
MGAGLKIGGVLDGASERPNGNQCCAVRTSAVMSMISAETNAGAQTQPRRGEKSRGSSPGSDILAYERGPIRRLNLRTWTDRASVSPALSLG